MTAATHCIDPTDRIVYVDDGWAAFAAENGAGTLTTYVIGRVLWEFITDPTTAWLYREIAWRLRQTPGRTREVDFRCDSPEFRRHMRMQIVADSSGLVTFVSRLLRVEGRATVDLSRGPASAATPVMLMCSWCKKVRTNSLWLELDDAIVRLRLFEEPELPLLSHGICADCQQRVMTAFDS